MAKAKTLYACQECGHREAKWLGRCPDCGGWNTLVEGDYSAEVSPDVWAARVVEAYHSHGANYVCEETQRGGAACRSSASARAGPSADDTHPFVDRESPRRLRLTPTASGVAVDLRTA